MAVSLGNIRTRLGEYPRQFWLMIVGVVLSTAGASMIWPFLLIYATNRLNLPLSVAAPLISINAGTGLLSSLIAGALADRIGRKTVMNISLTINGLGYFFLMSAATYQQFVILMIVIGFAQPLYQVGADAMLADLIPPEKRTRAYAISRIAVNAAFAMGPAVGGFLASRSYHLAFYGATSGFLAYSLLLLLLARETLTRTLTPTGVSTAPTQASDAGYGRVFQDRSYLGFAGLIGLGLIAPTMLWILLPIYAKSNFGLVESQYGWIPTTNAVMCVFLQFPVTEITRRYKPLGIVAMGMLVYAMGAGSVALMSGFWGFWLSMVVLTLGELILVPTSSKYVADLAPADLRGRYMSIYWLSWGTARTLAPLIGGMLNDQLGGPAIWLGGLTIGLISAAGLFILSRRTSPLATLASAK
ncbi:MAG TPA: MFS transporter [Anaerolineales bacterium]|nr:MFS transporter [Anaerolineales bacterium]